MVHESPALRVEVYIAPQSCRELLRSDFPTELMAVASGKAAKRERPLVQRTAEDDVVVERVQARQCIAL